MPRKLRTWYPGATYHIMERGIHRQNIFSDDFDYQVFLTLLANALKKYGCLLHAYCLYRGCRKEIFHFRKQNSKRNGAIKKEPISGQVWFLWDIGSFHLQVFFYFLSLAAISA